jgi:hypothetical protein
MSNVDNFIQEKVLPEFREIVIQFRELIHDKYPEVREEMRGGTEKYYGVPVYKLNKTLVTMSPTKKGITFNFSEGARFDDAYNVLEGEGNKTLNLRLQSMGQFDEKQIKYYIEQAIQFDSEL